MWYPADYYDHQQQVQTPTQLSKKQQRQLLSLEQSSSRQVCPHCSKELKNTHSLTVHISRYHRESSESSVEVQCPVCKRMYSNKYSLRTHMHLNHKDKLHLIGSGKKKGKGTAAARNSATSAAAAAADNSNAVTEAKAGEQFYYE